MLYIEHILRYKQLLKFIMVFYILGTTTLSCQHDYSDTSISITIDSQPTAKSFVVGDSIIVNLSYNIPIKGIDAKWYLNDTLYCTGNNFKFKATKKERIKVRHEAHNAASTTRISYEFDIIRNYGGNFLLNYATNNDIKPTIDYFINDDKIYKNVIESSEISKKIGNKLVSGILVDEKIYIISKTAPNLACIDLSSFDVAWSASFPSPAIEAHDFVVINKQETHGIISSTEGLYLVNLETKQIGQMVSIDQTVYGDLHYYDDKLYAISKDRGLDVYSVISDKVQYIRTIGMNALVGFAQTPDNSIWIGSGTRLVKINPNDLSYSFIDFPKELMIYEKWESWRNGTIVASANANEIYFAGTSRDFRGNKIYRYTEEDPMSLSTPYIIGNDNEIFCGESIVYDKNNNALIAMFINTDVVNGYNIVYFDCKTGERTYTCNFTGNLDVYPSAIIFDDII